MHKVLAKEPSARYRTADQLGRILISYRERGLELTGDQSAAETPAHGAPSVAPAPPPYEVLPEAPTAYRQPERVETGEAPVRSGDQILAPEYGGEEGLDWVAVALGFLAFISVTGLIPFWAYVASIYFRR